MDNPLVSLYSALKPSKKSGRIATRARFRDIHMLIAAAAAPKEHAAALHPYAIPV